jgi:hypothetical protein
VATGTALVMLAWTGVAWIGVAAHLDAGNRAGSAEVDLLARARIAALTARADEALTLVAHGAGDFDAGFGQSINDLDGAGGGGLLGLAAGRATTEDVGVAIAAAQNDIKTWRTVHAKLRDQANAGNYPEAVRLAVTGTGSAADAFSALDADLAKGIEAANAAFDREDGAAAGALSLAVPGLIVLTLLMLAGSIAGIQQRIAEYR